MRVCPWRFDSGSDHGANTLVQARASPIRDGWCARAPSSSLSSISSEHLSPLRQRRESSDAGQGFMQGHGAGLVAQRAASRVADEGPLLALRLAKKPRSSTPPAPGNRRLAASAPSTRHRRRNPLRRSWRPRSRRGIADDRPPSRRRLQVSVASIVLPVQVAVADCWITLQAGPRPSESGHGPTASWSDRQTQRGDPASLKQPTGRLSGASAAFLH